MTARCSGTMNAKKAHIISPTPPCITVGIRCTCGYVVFGFYQHGAMHYIQLALLFSVSLSLAQSDLGINLLGYLLLGRLAAVLNAFHL